VKSKTLLIASVALLMMGTTAYAKSTIMSWNTDQYNQKSIKPQEKGSMIRFPAGVVSVDGRYYDTDEDKMTWAGREMVPETATKNPVAATPESIARGKQKYAVYCTVCHGPGADRAENGLALSKVNAKGMVAPVMLDLSPAFTDGYLYGKIRFGGAVMPPLGYSTTAKERWDIINYVRALEKQQ